MSVPAVLSQLRFLRVVSMAGNRPRALLAFPSSIEIDVKREAWQRSVWCDVMSRGGGRERSGG